ncbi:MAG: S1 RNA-binding domain-containing protein [Planctomycetota bacterium]
MNATPESSAHSSDTQAEQPKPPQEAPSDAAPSPETPPAPSVPEPESLSPDSAAAMDAAMQAAVNPQQPTGDPNHASHHPGRPELKDDGVHAPRKLRGPRVVQGGREHRKGTVVSVGPEDVFVEFGPKELGVVPRSQYNEDDLPTVGEELEVVIERFEANEALFICSRPGAVQKADWELLQPGQVVQAQVTGTNKGGLQCEVAKHAAFMPASQVDIRRIEDLSVFVGETLTCKVMKVDRMGRGNITLSRRDILKEEQKESQAKLRESLKEGQTVEGVVKKIMPFGAFVDIGGIDALLHIGDMSHERVNKPEDVVKEGETVTVQVIKLDWEKNRHALGMKQLSEHPWDKLISEIQLNEGDVVPGTVTKLMDFGAFVEVAPGLEGLVHISELDWKRVAKTSDAVQPKASVQVKVLKIEKDKRKLSLSIKQAKDRPQQPGDRGKRRGKGEQDTRSADEILKETPQLRRMREQAKQKQKDEKEVAKKSGGIGGLDYLGGGLGDLKL